MIKENYELNIVSQNPKFRGETIVKHHIENIDTIGVWGEEPFEIQFKNHTSKRVQVRLSLDGTDVLTATPASAQRRTISSCQVPGGSTVNSRNRPKTARNLLAS